MFTKGIKKRELFRKTKKATKTNKSGMGTRWLAESRVVEMLSDLFDLSRRNSKKLPKKNLIFLEIDILLPVGFSHILRTTASSASTM